MGTAGHDLRSYNTPGPLACVCRPSRQIEDPANVETQLMDMPEEEDTSVGTLDMQLVCMPLFLGAAAMHV